MKIIQVKNRIGCNTIKSLENLFKQLVATSPKDLGYPFSRWTGQWLSKHLSQEFNIGVSARHINRLLGEIEVAERAIDNDRRQSPSRKPSQIAIADLYDRHISID